MSIHIRPAGPPDAQALALIGAASFLESFAGTLDGRDILAHCQRQHAPNIYAHWLADEAYRLWLATIEPGEAPIGYLVLGPADLPLADLAPSDCEVKRIYVLSRFQAAGLGGSLMNLAKEDARRRGAQRLLLGVYSKNDRAIAFYEREGFVAVGTRMFRVGEQDHHDLIFGLSLVEPPGRA